MATTPSCSPSDLPLEQLTLYHAVDPLLSSILVFYGPVTTANATVSSSRIQAHIFSPAGFQSYPRITVSPAAPLYATVNHLPREKQGDEVCRGLAVSMFKYFSELPLLVKDCLRDLAQAARPGGRISSMFDEVHAADVTNRLSPVDNATEAIRDLRAAYQERKVPWIDIDVVLPAGTIQLPEQQQQQPLENGDVDMDADSGIQYGEYSSLVRALGDPVFLPTSRLRRAPSQPTNSSRSRVFSRSQKEAFRLHMCELVDTEERYVAKMYTLVHDVADEFRSKARSKSAFSTSPDESSLAALFPPCLNQILDVNLGFLQVVRQVLEETERDVIADISQDTELPSSMSQRAFLRDGKDAVGSISFANALLEWFPRFSQPYADYMRAHTGFTQALQSFLRDKNSSFSKRVYETGEQKLRSLLMEPVQRLPRYSLLIDTMTSSLPLVHPAVRSFLKARDVIKDICSLDDPSLNSHSDSLKKLKSIVDGWPAAIFPAGRLINAVDFNELSVPYHTDLRESSSSTGIMLLYRNCLVLLTKSSGCNITARGLLAELDNTTSMAGDASGLLNPGDLRVAQVLDLNTVHCMQSACGRILFLAPASANNGADLDDLLALELFAMHEGRANRLIEEIAKARIEGRFSERERESGKWSLRSPTGTVGNLGILASVFEEDERNSMGRTSHSRIRVVFDIPKLACSKIVSNSDLAAVISVNSLSEDQFRLDVESIVGISSSDMVTADSFVPVLSKRRKYWRVQSSDIPCVFQGANI